MFVCGVRSSLDRLVARLVWAAPLLLLACTERTPNYCVSSMDCTREGETCDMKKHACGASPGGQGGKDGGSVPDTAGDRPADADADGGGDGDAPRDAVGADGEVAGDAHVDTTPAEVHTGCNSNTDCTADAGGADGGPSKPVCVRETGLCVGCLDDSDCKNPQAGVCDKGATTCVQCLTNADCTDTTTPICDAKVCRGCKVDADCVGVGPEVCMSHLDGRCATDDETVYVQGVPSPCSDNGAGTRLMPLCHAQLALDLVKAGRPATPDAGSTADGGDAGADAATDSGGGAQKTIKDLVVMRGGNTLWSIDAPGRTITVVGQANASVSAGSDTSINVIDGIIYLRGLHVSGGTGQPAVIASGGELHMDRCVVSGNAGGGVQISNAGFDISNSIIAGNGPATFNAVTPWSGLYLGAVPTGAVSRFVNNTVAENTGVGMVCASTPQTRSGIILWHNGVPDAVPACGVTPCCGGAVNPMLSVDYHLTAASTSCFDKLPPTMSTPYDVDGEARPSTGTLSDCGADEYFPPAP